MPDEKKVENVDNFGVYINSHIEIKGCVFIAVHPLLCACLIFAGPTTPSSRLSSCVRSPPPQTPDLTGQTPSTRRASRRQRMQSPTSPTPVQQHQPPSPLIQN